MAANSDTQVNLNLAFPNAGVVFVIKAESSSFHLRVTDSLGTRTLPLTVDTSPELADWVRGYSRWLVRAKVRASHDQDSITGTFFDGLTPEEMLQGVSDACDMIRQRFELYEQSVLVS
jgi:hypothetical protein